MASVNHLEAFAAASAHGITEGAQLVAFAYGYEMGINRNKAKLENCSITYFDIAGRGEPSRIALALSGVKFNDDRLSFKDFGAKKAAGVFPFGSVPVLTLADGSKICQSRAIARFIAKQAGLYPQNCVAAAHVDAVVDACEDLGETIMKSTRGIDNKSPEFLAKRKEVATTGKLAQSIEKLEKFVLNTGTEGFAVGNQLSLADVYLFHVISWIGSGFYDGIPADFADKFARIKSIRKNVGSNKTVAAYYDGKTTKNKFDTLYIAARDL